MQASIGGKTLDTSKFKAPSIFSKPTPMNASIGGSKLSTPTFKVTPKAPTISQNITPSIAPSIKPNIAQNQPTKSFIEELEYDIKNGATEDEIIKAYPEIKGDIKLVSELVYDIKNGATIDQVKQAYPELQATTPQTSQAPKIEAPKPTYIQNVGQTLKGQFGATKKIVGEIGTEIASGLREAGADVRKIQTGRTDEGQGLIGRTAQRISGIGEDIKQAKTSEVMGKQSPATSLLQSMGIIALGTSDTLADAFVSGLQTVAPQEVEKAVQEGIQKAVQTKGVQAVVQEIQKAEEGYRYLQQTDPGKARNYKALFGALSLAGDTLGVATVGKGVKATDEAINTAIKGIPTPTIPNIPQVPNLFKGAQEGLDRASQVGYFGTKKVSQKIGEAPITTIELPTKKVIKDGIDIKKSDDLIARGLKPSIVGKTTAGQFTGYNDKIRKGIESVAKNKGVPSDGVDALKKAGDRKQDIYRQIENNNMLVDVKTKVDSIADKINEFAITPEGKSFLAKNPGIEDLINRKLENWKKVYGDEIPQSDLQLLKQDYNKSIAKSDFQKIIQGDNPSALVDAKLAQVLGETIDDNVMQVLGNTNKALNLEYGSVRQLEKDLARRMGVFTRNTKGGLGGLLDTFNAGDIIMGALTGDIKQAGTGLIRKAALATIKRGENPNVIIKELFGMYNKKPKLSQKIQKKFGFEDKKMTLKPKVRPKTQKMLPQKSSYKEPAFITPQTLDKARILESKAELSKAKIVNPLLKKGEIAKLYDIYKEGIDEAKTIKELEEVKDFVKTHPKSKELLEEIDAKIDTIKAFQSIKDDVGGNLRSEYGDDLINAFKEVYKNEIMLKTTKGADKYSTIEFNKSAGFKRLSGKIEEYLAQSPWDDRTVQEVYETLKDKMVNTSVKDLNKPKLIKKSLDNKGGYINPSAIVDDITKAIKTLTPENITQLSVQIASKLKVSVSKVQAILKEYVQKYGAELKNKAGDLFDDLADRLGVRSKLMDGKGTGISGKIDAPKELIEEAKKYKSAEEFVNAQTNTYHGTSQTFDKFSKEGLGRSTSTIAGKKGFWFTDSPEEALSYAKLSGKHMLKDELKIEKEISELISKMERAEKLGNWDLAEKITGEIEILEQSSRAGGLEIVMPIKIDKSKLFKYNASGKLMNQGKIDEVITKAKKEGYDGVTFKNISDNPDDASVITTQHIIFDEKNIKTEAQLRDIWQQANK